MDPDLDDDLPRRHWLVDLLRTWLPALLLIVSVRTYAFEPYSIPSGSMAPVLEIGDTVVVDKLSYGVWVPATGGVDVPFVRVVPRFELLDLGDPKRGDIIVFRFPGDETQDYIKRVVAIPGDRISVRDNRVILDGVPQDRRFLEPATYVDDACRKSSARRYVENLSGVEHEMLTNAGLAGPLARWPDGEDAVEVPPDVVFVMGDNRDDSADSRAWGFVRFDQIRGKARFVAFSWDSCDGVARKERFLQSLQ